MSRKSGNISSKATRMKTMAPTKDISTQQTIGTRCTKKPNAKSTTCKPKSRYSNATKRGLKRKYVRRVQNRLLSMRMKSFQRATLLHQDLARLSLDLRLRSLTLQL